MIAAHESVTSRWAPSAYTDVISGPRKPKFVKISFRQAGTILINTGSSANAKSNCRPRVAPATYENFIMGTTRRTILTTQGNIDDIACSHSKGDGRPSSGDKTISGQTIIQCIGGSSTDVWRCWKQQFYVLSGRTIDLNGYTWDDHP